MRILIMGASRGIGLEATRQALAAGYDVRAFSRSAAGMPLTQPTLEKVSGNALDAVEVQAALGGVDVIIQSLGVGLGELWHPVHLFSSATRVLIAAMQATGVKRVIAVTGFGAGDSRSCIHWLQRGPFLAIFGRAYDDKSIQEQLLKDSGLDWTIARPGVLTGGTVTGRYRVLVNPDQWGNGIISRANVADFLVKQIEDRSLIGKAPVLIT